ncbi:hypothetical protein E2C01_049877 [Portunus trituberculatus]|uniref:Uncharacterized protein n=1 Tax=Portunus trituberculatus TaxID=210409 RepID=A0A5B7G6S0_PORTR|nr:hypothetical protein [Portunus trituberculatus]
MASATKRLPQQPLTDHLASNFTRRGSGASNGCGRSGNGYKNDDKDEEDKTEKEGKDEVEEEEEDITKNSTGKDALTKKTEAVLFTSVREMLEAGEDVETPMNSS